MAVEPSILQASGNTRALYERHGRAVYAFCLSRLGNPHDAEDALQATYLNALRGFRRGVVPELEQAWLFAIANRVIANRRRADVRRRRVETPYDLDELQDILAAPVAEAVDLARLRDALEAMPEQQRRAFLLREWQGLSCREIAAELGTSVGAVEQQLFRARRTLQQELMRPHVRSYGFGSLLVRLNPVLGAGSAAKVAAVAVVVTAAAHGHPPALSVAGVAPPKQGPPPRVSFALAERPVVTQPEAGQPDVVADRAPVEAQPGLPDVAGVPLPAPVADDPAPVSAGEDVPVVETTPAFVGSEDTEGLSDLSSPVVPAATAELSPEATVAVLAETPDAPAAADQLPPPAAAAVASRASAAFAQLPPPAEAAGLVADPPATAVDRSEQAAAAQPPAAAAVPAPAPPAYASGPAADMPAAATPPAVADVPAPNAPAVPPDGPDVPAPASPGPAQTLAPADMPAAATPPEVADVPAPAEQDSGPPARPTDPATEPTTDVTSPAPAPDAQTPPPAPAAATGEAAAVPAASQGSENAGRSKSR